MKERLHAIMFAGTGSDVGKSIISTGFCRIFVQDGFHPAPFKAQNMALNSYATPDGFEIGRAQAVQAEAAGIPCHTDMNPLLLKPSSDQTSQVVLNGKPIGNQNASEYFNSKGRDILRKKVCEAFDRLNDKYNPIVMEGAGSIAEINLRDVDLVNMSMAVHADADIILVADIDKGGVFASVYGTVMLLSEKERSRIKGIIINKFRGDMSLFISGSKMITDLCHIPVIGIVPFFKDIHIEEEDSVILTSKSDAPISGKINIAVVLLRHLSNFTDFDVLERDERVHLFYTNNTEELSKADIILIPGSKSTIDDLCELRRNGCAQTILRAYHDGSSVIGICGGYQIMGQFITDTDHIEGYIEKMPGLGLLPVETDICKEKVTRQVSFRFLDNLEECNGYEIHMGKTIAADNSVKSLNHLKDGHGDGCFVNNKCMGTYIHGILDNAVVIDYILQPYMDRLEDNSHFNYAEYKEEQYDKLAAHIRRYVDVEYVYKILKADQ